MKIFNIEIGKPKVQNDYDAGNTGGFVSRWARPPSLNTSEWLDMFSKSPRLAVVDRIASDLANAEGRLLRVMEDGSEVEVTDHPFLDFMEEPNPLYEMTSSAIWRLHEIYLLLVGEGFFLIERDNHGKHVELWNVPPHWVKTTPYLGNPYYGIVSPGGITMNVEVDDMFVMKQLNPLDPFMRGLGIAQSIADEVEIDEYAAKFQKRFFYNDATPPVVFSMPEATREQREEFLAHWNAKHKGVENSHRAAALSGNIGVHELNSSGGRSLDFVESRIALRDAVLEHFGVPREIMGITENSNRATADAAQYIYAKNVLTPKLKQREKAINKQLLPLFGNDLVWRFDAIIPYDQDFNKSMAIDGYNAGLIMKNEARELLSLDDTEGGDVYKIGINDLFLSDKDDPTKLTQSFMEEGQTKSRPVNINALLRNEEAAVRKCERPFEAAVTKHFLEQQERISQALGVKKKSTDDALQDLAPYLLPDGTFDATKWEMLTDAEKEILAEAVADGLLDWDAEAKQLEDLLTPLWQDAYEEGVTIQQAAYNIQNIRRPEPIAAARLNGGQRITRIEQTTKDKIGAIIARGVSGGKSQVTLQQEIIDVMGTSKARAKLIARQETMTSLATGQFDTMTAAGATTKTWHHRPQKNPRDGKHGPDHVSMEGETVAIDVQFSNGLMYPRDPDVGRPEEVINCRCYLTYGGF